MKHVIRLLSIVALGATMAACGPQDVTGASVDDAMNERAAKAKALDEKEGKAPVDRSAEMSQDPQLGAAQSGGAPPTNNGGGENPNTAGD